MRSVKDSTGRVFRTRGDEVCEWIEEHCVLTDSVWVGKPFFLLPWQKRLLYELFEVGPDGRRRYRMALVGVARKQGKALALNTPVPTPTGWTTMGEVTVGDEVVAPDGSGTRVVAVSEVFTDHDCYRLRFSNGEEIVADAGHQWVTHAQVDAPGTSLVYPRIPVEAVRPRTTALIARTVRYGRRGDLNHGLAMPAPLQGWHTPLPVDPYMLGVWLGDGNSRCARVTVGGEDLVEMESLIRAAGETLAERREVHANGVQTFGIGVRPRGERGGTTLQERLRRLELFKNKHIPALYLRASAEQRLALLQGLMDTDGYVSADGKVLTYVTVLPALADGVCELLATLGIKFRRRPKQPMRAGLPFGRLSYVIQFVADADVLPVFRLRRKLARQRRNGGRVTRSRTVQIVACEPVAPVPVRCLTVEHPSHQFLVGRTMLPTHNSELAAALGLYMAFGADEDAAAVYCAAASEDQADVVFEKARRMCELSDTLSQAIDVPKGIRVSQPKLSLKQNPYQFMQRLSAKGKTKHGLNPSLVILDELHVWNVGEGEELYEALTTAMAARPEGLILAITTAGSDLEASRCGALYKLGERLRTGEIEDPTFYYRWWEAPEGCRLDDPEAWKAASPSLGGIVDEDFYRGELVRIPEAHFRRLYLNQWVEYGESPWVQREQIQACRVDPFEVDARLPSWVGVDLSKSQDSTAVVWGQWRDGDRPCGHSGEPCLFVKARTWEKPDGKAGEDWRSPVDEVREFVRQLNRELLVATNVFDPYGGRLMMLDLAAEGILCEEMHQQGKRRSSAAAGMFDLIVQGRFHYDQDVIERHVMNATVKAVGDEGYYLQKRRAGRVMDAAQAASQVVYGTIWAPANPGDHGVYEV